MTGRPVTCRRLASSLMLISSIFWVIPAAGAENPGASYSLSQAAEGRGLYAEHCASCHGMNLLDNELGPALLDKEFQDRWVSRPVGQYVIKSA